MNPYSMNPIEYTLHWFAYLSPAAMFATFIATYVVSIVVYRAIRAAGMRAYARKMREFRSNKSVSQFTKTQRKLRNR